MNAVRQLAAGELGPATPDAGHESLLCLHGSLSSSRQWSEFREAIGDRYCVVTPDLVGYGRRVSALPRHLRLALDDEIAHLVPLLDEIDAPIHLVGHSYGAAVALKLARAHPERIRSLSLYEPVAFSLLQTTADGRRSSGQVRRLVADMRHDRSLGRFESATRRFIEYWSGSDAWERLPTERRAFMAGRLDAVLANFDAVIADRGCRRDIAVLPMPVLVQYGEASTPAAIAISTLLGQVLPDVRSIGYPGVGHLGPVTHGGPVYRDLLAFIDSVRQRTSSHREPRAA